MSVVTFRRVVLASGIALSAMVSVALAQEQPLVGVSWATFQEERWQLDEKGMKETLDRIGAEMVSTDAQGQAEKQNADVDSLLTRGVDVLVVIAQDGDAIQPAIQRALASGTPVVAYDRLIEVPGIMYVSHGAVETGRLQAEEILKAQPQGNFVFIKGNPADPNAHFLYQGQMEVLKPLIDAGKIKVVADQFIDGWSPELAQRTMEQILTANDNQVDAVVVSNDGMAGGVISALAAQGLAGKVAVSGQDGDKAALNRIARGLQTFTVFKDTVESGRIGSDVAIQLATGKQPSEIPGATKFAGGPKKVEVDALILPASVVDRESLDKVINAGWVTREVVCEGVTENLPIVCQN